VSVVAAKPPQGVEHRIDVGLQATRKAFAVGRGILPKTIRRRGIAQSLFGVAITLAVRRLRFNRDAIR
jgi:hypothetical protein